MSKEAMKLALEALQFALHVGFDESSESQIKKGDKAVQQHQKAITALREALAEQPAQQEPVAWVPYLSDRADGVSGHYAIARWNPRGYREVWNLRRHAWGAYSDDVLSLEEADTLLRLIEIPTRKVETPQPAQHPKAKAIAECLAVLRPAVKGKFPHEQALEELVGYIAAPQPAQPQQEPVAARHIAWDYLDNGTLVATYAVPVPERIAPKLYTSPPAHPKPLPYNKDEMDGLDINQRLGFKLGWKAAEEAHGIKENT